jgi:hypothetical protein
MCLHRDSTWHPVTGHLNWPANWHRVNGPLLNRTVFSKTKPVSYYVIITISHLIPYSSNTVDAILDEIIDGDQDVFRRNILTVDITFEVDISVNVLNIMDQYISYLWILRKPVVGSGEKHFVTF